MKWITFFDFGSSTETEDTTYEYNGYGQLHYAYQNENLIRSAVSDDNSYIELLVKELN